MTWRLSPTTTKWTGVKLKALAKANQYGGNSNLSKSADSYFYLALDIGAHKLTVLSRDDDDEQWDVENQWTVSTMGKGTIQYKSMRKHPNIRTTGAYKYTNDNCYEKGYSAYYWTHINYGSWFHSTLYSPGTMRSADARLGYSISNGCIRNPINKVKWLQSQIKDTRCGMSWYVI